MAEVEYRNLNNEDYWEKREEERVSKYWKKLENVEKEIGKQYRLALDDIRQNVVDLYTQYGNEQGLTYQDAVKELNSAEMGDYRAKLDRILPTIRATKDPFLMAELQKLSTVSKLTRFQSLVAQIEARLLVLGYDQQMTMEDWLSGVYEGNYYQAIYSLQVGTGMAFTFALINENAIREAITYPWSNEQYSDKIWNNRTLLVKELRQTITEGLIKGYGNQKMARILKDKMDSNYSNALRLVRTETNYVMGKATIEGYKQNGILSQYKIVVALDERTCKICQAKDGNVYELEAYDPAKTGLPFHPNCRCKIIPFFSDDDLKESQRIARGKDGERLYVPASMTYKEFQDKYLKGVPS